MVFHVLWQAEGGEWLEKNLQETIFLWHILLFGLTKLVGGLGHPSEKYDFVNWDDDIPKYMGKFQKWQPNHQPVTVWPNKI